VQRPTAKDIQIKPARRKGAEVSCISSPPFEKPSGLLKVLHSPGESIKLPQHACKLMMKKSSQNKTAISMRGAVLTSQMKN